MILWSWSDIRNIVYKLTFLKVQQNFLTLLVNNDLIICLFHLDMMNFIGKTNTKMISIKEYIETSDVTFRQIWIFFFIGGWGNFWTVQLIRPKDTREWFIMITPEIDEYNVTNHSDILTFIFMFLYLLGKVDDSSRTTTTASFY